jgi:pimeloyl-ACP methyl ester carboxylesterase
MLSKKNQIYQGAGNKESLYDLQTPENWNNKLIVFLHGYMGYKDWGCWNLVQDFYIEHQYGFLKYNVSHNGGTIQDPIDFNDLDSFQYNTYSKEIADFEAILNVINDTFSSIPEIYLIGHSRGGGTALLQSKHKSVSKIASWAGICSIGERFPKGQELADWVQNKFRFTKNGRTKQNMPHHICQYFDYTENQERLDIEAHCISSKKPTLIVHGEKDTSVPIGEGQKLSKWLNSELVIIPDTQHTFDSSQPWTSSEMPSALHSACELTLNFFNHE